ncbi:glyoxylate reductase [Sanguibacter hominis ATCC BAA-789]|uniref:Glyoxylate reductase n=1 Tax=Sanguibacter hominis ATCC BAA-789 TaxID=1312740 RepID=A0A9X5FEE7_9MICO|nr:NAD(P)-dependent oxidoreductase [Sanguibacter hominis]NKX92416.1 glyoxylate reductase [Sanguibacter hominis ATCC BAA-789]
MDQSHGPYVVGLTSDNVAPDGTTVFGDIGLERLEAAGLTWRTMRPVDGHAPTPGDLDGFDAILSFGHWPFSRELVAACPRLKHIARFGAGYDGIDPDDLAAEGVVLTNAPDGVRRPLALSALTLVLALSHELVANQRLVSSGRWEDRGQHIGRGVAGRTVGIVGFGSVGQDLAGLLVPLGARVVTVDRDSAHEPAARLGVDLVPLDRLAAESDYVVLTASLNPGSFHVVDATFLAHMRPTSYLVNVGRGPLVDQAALTAALDAGQIAGAALDVLEEEPPATDEPLLSMDQVIVTPHALCWTEDFVRGVTDSAFESLVDVAHGRRPRNLLNPAAYDADRGVGTFLPLTDPEDAR